MNIYIIGHVDLDNVDATCRKFNDATVQLMRQGYTTKSPVTEKIPYNEDRNYEAKYRTRYACETEGVFVMEGWQNDNIAIIELAIASLLNKKIICANDAIIPAAVRFTINKADYGQ